MYHSNLHTACVPEPANVTLQPGVPVWFNFTWNPTDDAGATVPTPGAYMIQGVLFTTDSYVPGFTLVYLEGSSLFSVWSVPWP